MLGKPKNPVLSAKGAETKGLLLFCVKTLENYMPVFLSIGGQALIAAQFLLASGKAAQDFESIMHAHDRNLDRPAQERLHAAFLRHVVLFVRAGGKLRPKHHAVFHMVRKTYYLGNPLCYSTYRDESLNGVIARIARSTHRWSLMRSVHHKFAGLQQTNRTTEMS